MRILVFEAQRYCSNPLFHKTKNVWWWSIVSDKYQMHFSRMKCDIQNWDIKIICNLVPKLTCSVANSLFALAKSCKHWCLFPIVQYASIFSFINKKVIYTFFAKRPMMKPLNLALSQPQHYHQKIQSPIPKSGLSEKSILTKDFSSNRHPGRSNNTFIWKHGNQALEWCDSTIGPQFIAQTKINCLDYQKSVLVVSRCRRKKNSWRLYR